MRTSVRLMEVDDKCDISDTVVEVANELDKIGTIAMEPSILEEITLTGKYSNITYEVKIDTGTCT